MRFLLDQPVSWLIGKLLASAGHEYAHVRELGLASAADTLILARAAADNRVIITQDTDYGTLLAQSGQRLPSVILLRIRDGRPSVQATLLLEAMPTVEEPLREGAVVVVTEKAVRIRRLPIR